MSDRREFAVDVSASPSLLQRQVEFHMARKPLSSSPNSCNFKLKTLNPCTSSPSSRVFPSSKRPDSSEFLDSALDPDLAFRIHFRRIGAGLENLGNTCFLNSVLQCLTYTEPFVAYLQSGKHQNTCQIAGFCALCAIHKHVSHALQSTGRILAPKYLVSNLRCISQNFRNARQQDAHEYMIHLLESMHKCCLPSGLPAESSGAYDKSLVHKIFGGRLRSQVKCLQCSYGSNTFDPFLDLSLEIVKADSLYKALKHFTAAEQLDGGERQYKCERCMQKVRACKQLTVHKAPCVLAIHLKRFHSYLSGQKIDKKVHFGATLDLKPFVSGAYEGDLKYTLYGVLVHAGWSTHSGHYYCFVRTSSGLWYSLDDNRVVQVSEKTVLQQKAYMLFYVRDRKNVTPKRGMDVAQKEELTTMQNASSSCSSPGLKVIQNSCVDKNTRELISSGLLIKDLESSKASEVLVQQNMSQSAFQPNSNNGMFKEGAPDSPLDSVTITSRSKLPNSSSSCPIESPRTNGPCPIKSPHHNGSCPIKSPTPNASCPIKSPCTNGSCPMKSPRTLRRQTTKEMLKFRVVGMHLSTKILYGASLSLRKRKKCKRIHPRKKNVLQVQLLNKDLVSRPSTSGRISGGCMVSFMKASTSCRGEGQQDASKKCLTSYDISYPIVSSVQKLKDTTTCSNTVLATSKLLQTSPNCLQEANDMGMSDSTCLKQIKTQLENGVTIGGTGPEKIDVGHWEGTESSGITKSIGQRSFSIGYVLDDWDEEYDRGKRKRVRGSRNIFGGPNLFQETVPKKAKLKAKTDYANQPFRI